MRKSAMYVVVFILLLIAVVIFCIARMVPGEKPEDAVETSAPTQEILTPAPTAAPEPTTELPEITPEPSVEPTATPEPEQTPEPTPTPEQTPSGALLGQGSFSSETGTGLELVVSWTATAAGDGTAQLDVVVNAQSYSFYTSELPGSISLTVDGTSYTLGSRAVEYDGADIILSPLAEKSVSIQLDSTGRANPGITVMWNYRGSYGGTEMENILAIGSAEMG